MRTTALEINIFRIKNQFIDFGFKSRTAFYNVCLELCPEVSKFSLMMFWDHGICKPSFFDKLDFVLEQLKNE